MKRIYAALAALLIAAAPARAETDKLRIGLQYGLPYMQLVIMQDRDFIGPRAKAAGMPELKAEFVTMGGPAVLNDSVISGALDIGAVGMSNLVTMWSKTQGNLGIRGLSGHEHHAAAAGHPRGADQGHRRLHARRPDRPAVGEGLDAGDDAGHPRRPRVRRWRRAASSTRTRSR